MAEGAQELVAAGGLQYSAGKVHRVWGCWDLTPSRVGFPKGLLACPAHSYTPSCFSAYLFLMLWVSF